MNKTKSKHQMYRLFLLLGLSLLLQGCVPIATGVITYNAGVSHGEHVAYTDYLIATQARNKESKGVGKPSQPILAEKQWYTDIYQIRLNYADYYKWSIEHGVPAESVVLFENWNETERQNYWAAVAKERPKPTGRQAENR